jgi:hypothetical protein
MANPVFKIALKSSPATLILSDLKARNKWKTIFQPKRKKKKSDHILDLIL